MFQQGSRAVQAGRWAHLGRRMRRVDLQIGWCVYEVKRTDVAEDAARKQSGLRSRFPCQRLWVSLVGGELGVKV